LKKSSTTQALTYHGRLFTFRQDGWFNMTSAAKHHGKDVHEFLRLPSTGQYVAALHEAGISRVYKATPGWHLSPETGTWAHPKLAVFFARWLDVRFAVWCDMQRTGIFPR
jgi:hypothetical protein